MPRTYGEMVDAGEPISDVFDAAISLHQALKESPIKGRIWRYAWTHDGREYSLAMSGHLAETVESIPPLHVAIEVDGWPRVLTSPFDGSVIGGPDTEPMVMKAIQDETARIVAA